MKNENLIKSFEHRARAARNAEKYDKILIEAKGALNEEEYATLIGHLQEPEEAEIIDRALTLVQGGVSASDIPGQLIEAFGITSEKARALTSEALQRHNPKEEITPGMG